MISRPIFVVSPPCSGAELLVRSLRRAEGLWTTGRDGPGVLDQVDSLAPAERGWASNRLTGADVSPEAVRELTALLKATLTDRRGRRAGLDASDLRWLEGSPRNALRIGFLDAISPDASFVLLWREPAEAIRELQAGWRAGRSVSYPELPGWEGPPWSYPLVPGWRELCGRPLAEIATEQWRRSAEALLSDLEALPTERWCVAERGALLADPRGELDRLCRFLGIEPDDEISAPLRGALGARGGAGRPAAGGDRSRAAAGADPELEALLPRTAELAERARELIARPDPDRRPAQPARESPLRSVHDRGAAEILERLGGSLLVSTYQTGKLICARYRGGLINTHFRDFARPMGIAARRERFALGTDCEVLDYRNMAEAAPKLDPPGTHDAAFLPRNRHFTGDIQIHEIAFARGELWVCATAFSCLATLDAAHSFVPRWKPPFVSELAPEDRCHLNGICVADDRVRYVTALGETDTAGGWRERKADSGVVIDVASGETVLAGLSMPHSPRWHRGRLWVLESGRGTIAACDVEAGSWETVCELPGFTRGLVMHGSLAFVGLSQVRETATFGGLPLTERLEERLCGVWIVDLDSGRIAGMLRFEELVQEVFDVAILPGARFPEIAEPGSDAARSSFALP